MSKGREKTRKEGGKEGNKGVMEGRESGRVRRKGREVMKGYDVVREGREVVKGNKVMREGRKATGEGKKNEGKNRMSCCERKMWTRHERERE